MIKTHWSNSREPVIIEDKVCDILDYEIYLRRGIFHVCYKQKVITNCFGCIKKLIEYINNPDWFGHSHRIIVNKHLKYNNYKDY